ncbi:MAG TPA: hypothetical protein VH208_06100, partial [Myxococcaceae bacterium]|nr:hypothetical protein [Myxococcaceae bacterium]
HAKGQGLKAQNGEATASSDLNAEASLASGTATRKLGDHANLSAHAELGHVQAQEQASFKASLKDMSIDGSVKIHVDASLVKAGATLSGDIPVQVNGEKLDVHYAVNLSGAVGLTGDINLSVHVGGDGARVTAQASGSVANASISARLEVDDDQHRELVGGQVSLGVAAGVGFAAGGGGGRITRLTGKDADPTAGLWKKGSTSSWGTSFNGKFALGPASGAWSAEVNPLTILRDIPKMVSAR